MFGLRKYLLATVLAFAVLASGSVASMAQAPALPELPPFPELPIVPLPEPIEPPVPPRAPSRAELAERLNDQAEQLNDQAKQLAGQAKDLEKYAKGIAISTALPSAFLKEGEVASIAGAVGGFAGETAIGFAGIVRLDKHIALQGSIGTDTDASQIGWRAGARIGW